MGRVSPRLQVKSNFGSFPAGNGRVSPRLQSTETVSTGSGSGSSGGQVDIKQFREQALKAHNERRLKHGVPPLKLSSDLNDYAQKWADHLVKTGSFQHSDVTLKGTRLGENIANKWSSSGADYTGEEATEQWYSEIRQHNFNSESNSGTGHFTQVVWKGSTELGMGKAKDKKGKVIVVGSYRPAGNMIGSFTSNVFPPK
ncbi:Golgi-associated plant pathogenesis-related protein 1 [Aplysia californica]|uniref:Golgi-associated plant pathogenesis-related protein 1 n=1 Tax=Aplysia californica TaxID=6500 RepID=A0ABM1AFQ8_APLCA|nr:Golgi-associated plant pathogenesis-related protein 1 [Aplysia californica]